MEITIDFDKKDPSYRDAFQRYYDRKKNIGFYFEWGYPKVSPDEDGFRRLHEVHDSRVCARATDVAFVDNTVIIKAEPFGAMKDLLNKIAATEISVGARMLKNVGDTKTIRQIVGLDIVLASELPELLAEVTVIKPSNNQEV